MGLTANKWSRAAFVIAPAAFCIAVLTGLFVPVYTDEIGWRLQERAGLDGIDKLFNALCGPTSMVAPPLWMMPARYYSAFWNVEFPSPLYTRISGIIYALVWSVLLALMVRRIAPNGERYRILTTLAFAMMTIGLTPWLLIWSRPEQPILICLTAALWISAKGWDKPVVARKWRGSVAALAIVCLSSVAVSYHLKAVFLAPVFVACVMLSNRSRDTLALRFAAAATTLIMTADAARYWIARLRCPAQSAYLSSQNLGSDLVAAKSVHEAGVILLAMVGNINPFPYIGRTAPRPNPMSAWLVELQINIGSTVIWWVAITFLWSLVALFAANTYIRQAKVSRLYIAEPRLIIACTLLISMTGWIATQVIRNDYEAALIVPQLLMMLLLVLSCEAASRQITDNVRVVALAATGGALVSMILVGYIFGTSLISASHQQGYIARQPYSISAFGYDLMRTRIQKLADQCGIVAGKSRNLILDDLTYYTFMTNPTPDHVGGFGEKPAPVLSLTYLRARRSEGVIATCSKLPDGLRARAKSDGELCCLAPTWNEPLTRPVK
jgi:hypothetical protein